MRVKVVDYMFHFLCALFITNQDGVFSVYYNSICHAHQGYKAIVTLDIAAFRILHNYITLGCISVLILFTKPVNSEPISDIVPPK